MRTISSVIAAALAEEPVGDPAAIAARIIHDLSPEDLVALLAQEVASQQRSLARESERQVFRAYHALPPLAPLANVAPEFRSLFRTKFALGDGHSVTWGKATIEQHVQRIQLLQAQREGLWDTIKRHRDAIKAIQEAGVSCLDEIQALAA